MTPLKTTLLALGLLTSLAAVNAQGNGQRMRQDGSGDGSGTPRQDGSGNPSRRGNNQGRGANNQQRNANRQENVTLRNERQSERSADCTGTGVPKRDGSGAGCRRNAQQA